jgi:hypothetical protein
VADKDIVDPSLNRQDGITTSQYSQYSIHVAQELPKIHLLRDGAS